MNKILAMFGNGIIELINKNVLFRNDGLIWRSLIEYEF